MRRIDPLVLAAFVATVVFFGVNFVAVRFSNRELPPFWGGTLRFAIAATLLCALVGFRGLPLPRGQALAGALLYGSIAFGVNYPLVYWALVDVPAAMAAVAFSTIPLITVLMTAAIGQERFQWRALAGALIALGGSALVLQEQLRLDVPLERLGAIFLAAFTAALPGIIVRGFPSSHPITVNAMGMALGALCLFAGSLLAQEDRVLPALPATYAAIGWLVLSSCVAFVLTVWILHRWTASAVAYSGVLTTLVTVGVAAWLAGEAVTPWFLAGGALVLGGVYFGALSSRPAS